MYRLKKIITSALVWLLCGALSGTFPALASGFVTPKTNPEAIHTHLQMLLRRTLYAGTPGTPPGIPSIKDLQDARETLLSWKKVAEQDFAAKEESAIIDQYFKALASLTLLEIALQQPLSASQPSPSEFDFKLFKETTKTLPSLRNLSLNRTGDLHLKTSFIEQLKISALTSNASDENFFRLMQTLATRQLFQNLGDLHYLKGDRAFQNTALAESNELLQEQHKSLFQKQITEALLLQAQQLNPQVPEYIDRSLIRELSKISSMPARKLVPLFKKTKEEDFSTALRTSVQNITFENDSVSLKTLRQAIVSAKRALAFEQLFILAAEDGPFDDSSKIKKAAQLLDSRSASFAKEIPDTTLNNWIEASRKAATESLYDQRRISFIDNLVSDSFQILTPPPFTKLSPAILVRSFATKIAQLQPSDEVRSALFEISQQATYAEAQRVYETFLRRFSQTGPLELDSPVSISSELKNHLNQRAAQNRKQNATQLKEMGNWLGFNGNPPEYDFEKYGEAFKKQLLGTHPILNIPVMSTTGDTQPLYQALSSPTVTCFEEAVPWIDQALIQIETNIVQDLQKIQSTKDLRDLEEIVTSSMMLQLVLSDFPEFRNNQERFTRELLAPTLSGQLMRHYVGPYMGAGIVFLLLAGLKKLKRAQPYAVAFEIGLGPFFDSYIHSILTVMLADYAYQVNELFEARKTKEETDRFFFSSATEISFFNYAEKMNTDAVYTSAQRQLLVRVAIDTTLGAFFAIRPLFRRAPQ